MPRDGRPRRNTPEQVRKAVDEMIARYQETGDVAALTDFTLLSLLGNIAPRTLERYYDGTADKALLEEYKRDNNTGDNITGEEYTKATYGDALKRLIEYRRAACVQHIAGGGASTTITGWIFLSKQPHWGGFQDVQRQEIKGNQTFTVKLAGPDGASMGE